MGTRLNRPGGRIVTGLALTALAGLTVGCGDHPGGTARGNLKPHVQVTGGPREGTRDSYKTRIYWTGWDDDGVVVDYEYALDPPDVFSPGEIASPESFPGITITVRRGPRVGSDTLGVAKIVDGTLYAFDYVQTRTTDRAFRLTTATSDSNYVGSRLEPKGTSSDYHRIYVRCLDNEGAYSDVARIAFTAWSYAPSAWISFPLIKTRPYLDTGGQIRIAWYGVDPDPPEGTGRPAGYLYKLVNLSKLEPPLSTFHNFNPERVCYKLAADIPWIYQSAETSGVKLFVEPGDYLFAVRAVDAEGAVEPFIDFNRGTFPGNAFKFTASTWGGRPTITLNENTLGSFVYRGAARLREVEVALGVPLTFRWFASAAQYGGKVEAYSWGLDVSDLEAEGPGSGWSPWGAGILRSDRILFRKPGLHVFYVRARDSAGTIQIASLALKAFEIPLDREVLFLDDYRDQLLPLDGQHDAWWDERFRNSGRFTDADLAEGIWRYDTGGPNDRFYLTNHPPKLSELGRYRLAIWNVNGDGWCGNSGFFQGAVTSSLLRSYLASGGKLWIVGSLSLAATLRGVDCNSPDRPFYDPRQPTYPAADTEYPLAMEPGDFAFDVLRIASLRIENDRGEHWENTMVAAEAYDPEHPILNDLWVDAAKFNPTAWENRALPFVDAVFDPILLEGLHDNPGSLEPIYKYVAANEVRPVGRGEIPVSPFRDKICATRWHDPDPARTEGRVAWFGFPLYFMLDDQAQDAFNRMVDWFREESPPAAP